jgi:hypothetical protein
MLSQTTWLQSSNIANTEFYNSHGFFTIAEVVVGENNPTWDGEPVVVSIVRPRLENCGFVTQIRFCRWFENLKKCTVIRWMRNHCGRRQLLNVCE